MLWKVDRGANGLYYVDSVDCTLFDSSDVLWYYLAPNPIIKIDAHFKRVLLHSTPSYSTSKRTTSQRLRLLRGENISPLLTADLSEYALDFDLLQIKHNAPRATSLG